ncbi:MAG TPA: alpha/beta fold hydrolase [Gemmatimonadota bacterium]|nr:alpha/beta fold hydrolase [Gemmatimonadota bacterium]
MIARFVIAWLLWAAMPDAAAGQDAAGLAGEWVGAWGRAADTLAVTMRFAERDGAWSGSFDAPRLRVEEIPFTSVRYEPPRVTIEMEGDRTTLSFEGRLQENTLAGILREEGDTGWFSATRATGAAPALPEADVRFANAGVELAGTLVLPSGPGPHPAVVFLHGSGAEGRWASRFLARRFAERGFAGLIWDKRGVGESKGDWNEAGFDDLAADAAAAIAFLRARPEIDSRRVGIHGHSQGGTIAPMVAVRAEADFVIASAAAGVPMADSEIYSLENFIGVQTLSEAEAKIAREYVRALVDVAYRGAPRESLDAAAARARGHAWFFEPPALDDSYWRFSPRIADFDPLAWWRQIRVPVLLVYGSADGRVPVEPSRAAIVGAIQEAGGIVEARVFDGADHTFRVRREGDVWPRTVEEYPDAILDWLRAH